MRREEAKTKIYLSERCINSELYTVYAKIVNASRSYVTVKAANGFISAFGSTKHVADG